ncbi:Cloroperoxidase [Exidia glandulosa HHB12029]|uniref:Cloroperoxidase n=1 Tax=Exidia glandulosa HHB12029 TaxID=1314781 RepID=A0A165Q534_EXIGL|nr:Cloroperoxidase [Exidia glandulosa HHB12029]
MFLLSHIYIVLALQLGSVLGVALRPYDSLAGLTRQEVDAFARSVKVVGGQPAPPVIADTSSKLVNDKEHPWLPLAPGQQRGPCPGLNTLASHGYLPRSGVATPAQIVTALTYGSFLVDGNPLTNLMSIGSTSSLTGAAPPKPALVSGLSTHGTFEGDASMTRSDAFLGDNHSFNETLFDQLVQISKEVGGGKYNITAATEMRFQRFQDSVARNPTFNFANPRFATAFAETAFPLAFFIDGRDKSLALDLDVMRGFFKDSSMPPDFHRRDGASDAGDSEFDIIQLSHNYFPGFNNGTGGSCISLTMHQFVNTTMELYPNPQGALRRALNVNLDNFFIPVSSDCAQLHPFP